MLQCVFFSDADTKRKKPAAHHARSRLMAKLFSREPCQSLENVNCARWKAFIQLLSSGMDSARRFGAHAKRKAFYENSYLA